MRLIYDVYLMLILCQHIFKTCLVSKDPVSLCCLVGEDLGKASLLERGVPRWQGPKHLPLETWTGAPCLSRKGSFMHQSDCGGVSTQTKSLLCLNRSPLRHWGLGLSGFGSTWGGMQAGVSGLLWPLWVCGWGMCADVCCMK